MHTSIRRHCGTHSLKLKLFAGFAVGKYLHAKKGVISAVVLTLAAAGRILALGCSRLALAAAIMCRAPSPIRPQSNTYSSRHKEG